MKPFLVFTLVCAASGACGGAQPVPSAPASTIASPATPPPGAKHVTAVEVPPSLRAAVEASNRSEKDRELDAGRRPAELLAFAAITPRMRVAELGAGGGYTTELFARAVGPDGTVYGQNNKFVLERFAAKPWNERLAKTVMKNVVRVDRELDDPFPTDAKNLDAVLIVLVYHDFVWLGVDRDKMNRAIFAALKPGGEYIVVDHSAKAATGLSDVKTLHRIDEKTAVDEITRAGFTLSVEGDFLRNPNDARDWNASPSASAERRGTSDRFVLKFVRP